MRRLEAELPVAAYEVFEQDSEEALNEALSR
jgi:hypothetical protein